MLIKKDLLSELFYEELADFLLSDKFLFPDFLLLLSTKKKNFYIIRTSKLVKLRVFKTLLNRLSIKYIVNKNKKDQYVIYIDKEVKLPVYKKINREIFSLILFYSGYIKNLKKSYYLEITFAKSKGFLFELVKDFIDKYLNINYNLYSNRKIIFRNYESLSSVLALANLTNLFIKLQDIKIQKEINSYFKRKVNYETANIDKVITASQKYIRCIKFLKEINYQFQDELLAKLAEYRLLYPDYDLKTLGSFFDPPLSKVKVFRLLSKIKAICNKKEKEFF